MAEKNQNTPVMVSKDLTSNPAPIGLLGFGMTTVLLNLHNAGIIEKGSVILAMGIFYGGIAQLIAGIMEWKKGNTFGSTAFISYGMFWLTLVGIWTLPALGLAEKTSTLGMGYFLMLWGVFTLIMFLGTFNKAKATQFVFGSLTVLFVLLAAGDFTGNKTITMIAGIEGLFCGASAIYDAFGQILNGVYGKTILPLGERK